KESQLEFMEGICGKHSEIISDGIGLKYNISRGQICDSCVKHGESRAETIDERTNARWGLLRTVRMKSNG
ncbi:MAG TPA: hypothetical protein PKK43_07260, partial [Spirochaetota bacterium]|nr:hypothetical protein [Spirochaetota bacterium]